MTTWVLPILTALLAAIGAVYGTRHQMRLDSAKERSDRDSERARAMRDELKEKRRVMPADGGANVFAELELISDEAAFLHNAELRARLAYNFERAAGWREIYGYASKREVIEVYLGDAIADLEAAVRGDRLPGESHRAAWLEMIRATELPAQRHFTEVAAEMLHEGMDPDYEELAYMEFCEKRERGERRRLPLPFRKPGPPV